LLHRPDFGVSFFLEIEMNIYVSNIPFKLRDEELRGLFESYGEVSSARILKDRETRRSRGFGFVEMPDDGAGQNAIDGLNGRDIDGRALVVHEAKPRD
jgi:RNA recognition motif-containing protein